MQLWPFFLTGIRNDAVVNGVSFLSKTSATNRAIMVMLFITILNGCASNIPDQIKQPANTNLTPIDVRNQPMSFIGQAVRWGGTIIRTENRQDHTRLIILAKPLGNDGQPQTTDTHQGRFIAQSDHFIEPSLYAAGRQITVYGTLKPATTEMVDEYPYVYPVVEVQVMHLWPLPSPEPDYWYDPWYDPWYPWYPFDPWYPRYRYPHHKPTQKTLPP